MSAPLVSVVIPTYNRAQMVCDCVRSVLATNYPALEVIVVDDCSPDDTGGRIAAEFGGDGRVKYQRNEMNLMVTGSRNAGGRKAAGDYLLFLDHDNVVEPNMIDEMLACFARHDDAKLVGAISINRHKQGPDTVWSAGNFFNRWTSQPVERYAGRLANELPEFTDDQPTTYAPSAFMVRKETFDSASGFDPEIGMMFDESDFGWRILRQGGQGYYSARARTLHMGHADPLVEETPLRQLGIEKPRRTYCFARNRLRFARRHFNLLQILSVTLIFAPLSAIYYGLVALKNRRPDIAWSYFRGTLAGIFGL